MKGYIYFIINNNTKERYVGKTTNFTRRKKEHISKLNNNCHPNPKLQSSWNKHSEASFHFEKILYDNITDEELSQEEVRYIEKFNSFEKGYNLTLGGTGGDTRSKLTFEQFCLAYFGNKKYLGMTSRTGALLGVDSSCISSIKNEKSYDTFRERAKKLYTEEKEKYIELFEQKTDIKNNPAWVKQKTLDEDTTYEILCVVSTYGRGIESAILKKFGLTKGFVFHTMTGKSRIEVKEKYYNTTKEERERIGEQKFTDWELASFSKTSMKKSYKDLFHHYGLAD